MSRRERFRSYMARMAAAADPARAIEQQMYVRPPRPLADEVVSRLEIRAGGATSRRRGNRLREDHAALDGDAGA